MNWSCCCWLFTLLQTYALASRNLTVIQSQTNKVIVESTNQSQNNTIWFTFYIYNGYASIRINSTQHQNGSSNMVDYRSTPLKVIEFNDTISIDQSTSTFNFTGQNWTSIEMKNSNSTGQLLRFTSVMQSKNYTSDGRPWAFGLGMIVTSDDIIQDGNNLTANSVGIVPVFQNYPYQYINSTLAFQQLISSRDQAGLVAMSVGKFGESSIYRGFLVINETATDGTGAPIPIVVNNITDVAFNAAETTNMTSEKQGQSVTLSFVSKKQPKVIGFFEQLGIYLGSMSNNSSSGDPPTTTPSPPVSAANSMTSGIFLTATLLLLTQLF